MSIISNIVGRCSVGDSDLRVYCYLRSRMNNKVLKARPKAERREIVRSMGAAAIAVHHENQELYRDVMGGS
jgi:hypothetical protein